MSALSAVKRKWHIILLIALLIVLIEFLYLATFESQVDCGGEVECPFADTRCEYLYFDLGSNVGIQTRKLFQPAEFPDAYVKKHFDKYYPTDRTRVCSIGFEPNPTHRPTLDRISDSFTNKGYRVIFYPYAAYHENNPSLEFFSDNDPKYNYWGSSLSGSGDVKYPVTGIDVAQFLKGVMNLHRPKAVLMKLDIEGAEQTVIPRMIEEGTFCDIDLTMVELHFDGDENNRILNLPSHVGYWRKFGCRGWNVMQFDDETYMNAPFDD